MTGYILDWLQLLLRFLHVITGIAWIGASFYFVWLDNHLRKPESDDLKSKGVDGELWAVHGGGFYNPQKYLVAPKELPADLHWFYWESYSTWLSGIALFLVVYLLNAKTMLIDQRVMNLSEASAITLALSFLTIGWVIYDLVCRRFQDNDKFVGLIVTGMMVAVTYATCHIFSARAAFLITGAIMATAMTANVFFWIIPGQRAVIKSMKAGEPVDPIHGKRGKQRSVHNTYFTLPVLFAMLSNHFHMIYSHQDQWVLLILMMLAAALIRHYFVLRHKGRNAWGFPLAGSILILLVAIWAAPSSQVVGQSAPATATLDQVTSIINQRCVACHSDQPTLMPITPKNLNFRAPGAIEANAAAIYLQVVQQKIMPVGNITEMTDAERATIQAWFENRTQ
jgi:uncharacterized membrane protein